jgi:hypothetical protein
VVIVFRVFEPAIAFLPFSHDCLAPALNLSKAGRFCLSLCPFLRGQLSQASRRSLQVEARRQSGIKSHPFAVIGLCIFAFRGRVEVLL